MRKLVTWIKSAELASDAEVNLFEEAYGFRFSQEHRKFLIEQTNGGKSEEEIVVPTTDCPGGAGALHGLYGINHPQKIYDLGEAISALPGLLPSLVPFGFDQGSGEIFVDMSTAVGRLVYIPIEELRDIPPRPYHVANSIAEFIEAGVALAKELNEEDD